MNKYTVVLALQSILFFYEQQAVDFAAMAKRLNQALFGVSQQEEIDELKWCPAQNAEHDQQVINLVHNAVRKFYNFVQQYGEQGIKKAAADFKDYNHGTVGQGYIFVGASNGLIYVDPLITDLPAEMNTTQFHAIWRTLFANAKKANYESTWVFYPWEGSLKRAYIAVATVGNIRYLIGSGYFCD